jgi:hypothetical protein
MWIRIRNTDFCRCAKVGGRIQIWIGTKTMPIHNTAHRHTVHSEEQCEQLYPGAADNWGAVFRIRGILVQIRIPYT